MALQSLVKKNNNRKIPVTMQYHNLRAFIKQGVILLNQSTIKTRQIAYLFSSAIFTIPTALERENYHKQTQQNLHRFEKNYKLRYIQIT